MNWRPSAGAKRFSGGKVPDLHPIFTRDRFHVLNAWPRHDGAALHHLAAKFGTRSLRASDGTVPLRRFGMDLIPDSRD